MPECDDCIPEARPVPGFLPWGNPGEPLIVFAGAINQSVEDREVSAQGQVVLTWKKRPHLGWSVDLDSLDNDANWSAWRYRPEQPAAQISMDFTDPMRAVIDVQFGGDGKGWIPGGTVGDHAAPLKHVVAHWINLPMILPAASLHEHTPDGYRTWSGRWRTVVDDWIVTIDARPDHSIVYPLAADAESFVMTHTMDLRRTNDTTFTGADAAEILSALQYAVSFAVGHWTCPAVPVGYGLSDEVAWSQWHPLHAGRPRRGAGWWIDTRAQDLIDLVTAYFNHWTDPRRREPLRFATTSAILAVETGFVEQRLQTAYSALEMLSWTTEVLEGRMDEDQWRYKHDSAWRVRRLLISAGIKVTFDHDSKSLLAQFAKSEAQGDAPAALAVVRHRLTHPKNPTDLYQTRGLIGEASRLACHYLELAILHRINFRGQVADRTRRDRWVGEGELVPWAKPANPAQGDQRGLLIADTADNAG